MANSFGGGASQIASPSCSCSKPLYLNKHLPASSLTAGNHFPGGVAISPPPPSGGTCRRSWLTSVPLLERPPCKPTLRPRVLRSTDDIKADTGDGTRDLGPQISGRTTKAQCSRGIGARSWRENDHRDLRESGHQAWHRPRPKPMCHNPPSAGKLTTQSVATKQGCEAVSPPTSVLSGTCPSAAATTLSWRWRSQRSWCVLAHAPDAQTQGAAVL
jgi:hypothetical protein